MSLLRNFFTDKPQVFIYSLPVFNLLSKIVMKSRKSYNLAAIFTRIQGHIPNKL